MAQNTTVPTGSKPTTAKANSFCRVKHRHPIHFFQSADLFTRPDGADLNSVRRLQNEVAWIKSHLNTSSRATFVAGFTSVVDVADRMWNFEVRKTANSPWRRRHASPSRGPLISSVSREKLASRRSPIVGKSIRDQARDFVTQTGRAKS